MLPPATPPGETHRLQILKDLEVLDTPSEERFDRITQTAARLFEVPIALVSLLDECRQWFKSRHGLDAPETAREISFCGHAILGEDVFVVEDTLTDLRFHDNPLVTGPPHIRFYAGCPLKGPEGAVLGTLCLIDRRPRNFSISDQAVLRDLAAWAERELNQVPFAKALASAQEGERFFRYSLDLIHLAGFDGFFKRVNPAYARILGYTEEELLATPIKNLIHPEDLAKSRIGTRRLEAGEVITEFKHRLRHKDGSYRWIAWKGFAEGPVIYGFGRDITPIKEAEDRLQALLSAIPDEIFRQARDGAYLDVQASDPSVLMVSAQEFLGKHMEDLLPLSVARARMQSIRDALRTGKIQVIEYSLMNQGRVREYEARTVPVSAEEVITIVRDVTERRLAEQAKRDFISMVSHELRTPLTSIRGSLGLLDGGVLGPLPPKVGDLVAIAQQNAERLVRLVNDILDLDKVENGKMQFHLAPCQLEPLMLQAMDSAKGYVHSMGAEVALEPEAPEAWVEADADRLVQVLINLLGNAAKYSPQGEAVRLGASRSERGWRIEVEDHGPGIPADFRASIFQKFAQAESLDTRHKNGSGLGLSIAKAMVEGMGGSIGFHSEPKHTLFYVELPEAMPEIPAVASSKPRVLVVEDDPLSARLLEATLAKEGFAVDKAATAAEAMDLLSTQRYDAMTLDLLLPDKHGLELLEEIRRNPDTQDLRVLVASSVAEEGKEKPEVPALQVLEWIQKPLDPFRLAQAFACLRSPSLREGQPQDAKPVVLHVEDDWDVHQVLSVVLGDTTDLLHARTLGAARKLLLSRPVDLVILDSHLPDGRGADLIPDVHAAGGPTLPILLFSGEDADTTLGAEVSRTLQKSSASNLDIQRVVQSLLRER